MTARVLHDLADALNEAHEQFMRNHIKANGDFVQRHDIAYPLENLCVRVRGLAIDADHKERERISEIVPFRQQMKVL